MSFFNDLSDSSSGSFWTVVAIIAVAVLAAVGHWALRWF